MGKYNLYFVLLFVASVTFLIACPFHSHTRFADGFASGSDAVPLPQANGSSSSSATASQQIVLPAGSSSSSNLSNILNNTGRLFSSSSSAPAGPRRIQLPPFQITFIRDRSSNDDSAYISPEFDNEEQTTEAPAASQNTSPTVSEEKETLSTAQIAVATLLIGSAIAISGAAVAHMFGVKM